MDKRFLKEAAGLAKKLLFLVATMVLVWALAQTLPFDLAILMAGDTLLYAEIVSTVWIASRIANLRAIVGWAKLVMARYVRRSGRRRALRTRSRATRKAPSSDDEGRAGLAVA